MASRAAELPFGRRVWRVGGAVVLAAAAAVVVGRWERHTYIEDQVSGIEHVVGLVGPLDQPSLDGYRVLPQFDCLVYRRGANLLALELCIGRTGRVVEAADRLSGSRIYYSLRPDPADSSVRVDRAEVDRLLRKMGAE